MHWTDVDKAIGPGTLCLPVLRPAYAKTRLSSRTVDDLPAVLTETPAPWKSRWFPNSSMTNKIQSLALSPWHRLGRGSTMNARFRAQSLELGVAKGMHALRIVCQRRAEIAHSRHGPKSPGTRFL